MGPLDGDVAHAVPAGGVEFSKVSYSEIADSTVAKFVTHDAMAAVLASLPMVDGPVVVVVALGDPDTLVCGFEGVPPLAITIVTMTPRMTTTASVEIMPTPRSDLRRRVA